MADADSKDTTTTTDTSTETKPAVTFKTEGEFLAAVSKKTKGEVAKAVETVRAEMMEALGLESLDDVPKLKERLASTEKSVTEAEKLKSLTDRQAKDIAKAEKKVSDLSAKLHRIAKRDALLPFNDQVVDAGVVAMLVDPLLEVDEDGGVSVKDGRALENVIGELLKAKPFLKKSDAATGAGTTATEPRPKDNGTDAKAKTDAKDTGTKDANGTAGGRPKSWGDIIVAGLVAEGKLPSPTNGP
jgi:hypothetical protein